MNMGKKKQRPEKKQQPSGSTPPKAAATAVAKAGQASQAGPQQLAQQPATTTTATIAASTKQRTASASASAAARPAEDTPVFTDLGAAANATAPLDPKLLLDVPGTSSQPGSSGPAAPERITIVDEDTTTVHKTHRITENKRRIVTPMSPANQDKLGHLRRIVRDLTLQLHAAQDENQLLKASMQKQERQLKTILDAVNQQPVDSSPPTPASLHTCSLTVCVS